MRRQEGGGEERDGLPKHKANRTKSKHTHRTHTRTHAPLRNCYR